MQKITIKLHSTTNTGSITGDFETVREAKIFLDEHARLEEIRQIIANGMNDIFAKLQEAGHNVKDLFPDTIERLQVAQNDILYIVEDVLNFREKED